MTADGVTSSELISWVEKAIEGQNFSKYEINLVGKTEKGDGYLGEVVFANVDGNTKDNERRVLDLVIKHGKINDHLRKTAPVRSAFEKEIYIYEMVFPIFRKFQFEKNIRNSFDSVPRCYKTIVLDNMEVLVLDNLKKLGYELHDRKKPLNVHHIKAVLKEYGKLHALSFALRDQKSGILESISDPNNNVFENFLSDKSVKESIRKNVDEARDMLKERGDLVLYNKFKNLFVKNPGDMLSDLMDEKEAQSVITHGDCWNNNFMFKYENEDRTYPSKIAILDWQLSSLRSPALDLSYFIYTNSSKDELSKFNEIMETYYASFSHFLRELGSNPDELFSFSDLKKHWKKYSLFGLIFVTLLLRIALCDQEDAPALEDLREDEDMGNKMHVEIKDKDAYYERLQAVVNHYFDSNF